MIKQIKKQDRLTEQIQYLESAGNDHFALIIEFGAEAYTVSELTWLNNDVTRQRESVIRWEQLFFLVGIGIAICLGSACIFAAMNMPILSFIFLSGVPLSLLATVLGHFLIRRQYPAYKNAFLISSIISQELDKRRKDASIF